MSDLALRLAERSEDQAAVLRRRIRSGELDEPRVALAAFLGYEPALLAAEPAVFDVPDRALGWLPVRKAFEFGGLDKLTAVTISCDFADHVPQCLEGQAMLAVARAWVVCPCEEHRLAAGVERPLVEPLPPPDVTWALVAAGSALLAAAAEEVAAAAAWASKASPTAQAVYGMAEAPRKAEKVWQTEHMAYVLCWGEVE